MGAAAAAARRRRARRAAGGSAVHRLRVQDPGEHGSEASRPHRVLPRVLGPLPAGDEGAAPAHRPRDEARQRADVHGQRARRERGRGRRRHHRHPQPRAAADRRHADRRRGARLQGHSVFRAGAVPRRAAARSVQGEAAAEGPAASWARKARSRCSRRRIGNTLLLGAVGQLQFEVVARPPRDANTRSTRSTTPPSISTARWLTFPDESDAPQLRARAARRRWPPTSTAIRCSSRPTSTTCR